METMTTETPAHLCPTKSDVERLLSELGKSKADLSEYAAKAARTGLNQEATLDDDGFTENELADELGRLQNLKNVFSARIARKEKAVARLEIDIKSAVEALTQELSLQVQQELERRRAILMQRVVMALELPSDQLRELNLIIGYSPLIRAIQDCEPRNYSQLEWGGGKISLERKAIETLERAGRLESEVGRGI